MARVGVLKGREGGLEVAERWRGRVAQGGRE